MNSEARKGIVASIGLTAACAASIGAGASGDHSTYSGWHSQCMNMLGGKQQHWERIPVVKAATAMLTRDS